MSPSAEVIQVVFQAEPTVRQHLDQQHHSHQHHSQWNTFLRWAICLLLGCWAVTGATADLAEPPRNTAAPAIFEPAMPTIPESISRPEGWPTTVPASVSKNVLSSILDIPGGDLEPVDAEGNLLLPVPVEDNPQGSSSTKREPHRAGSVVLADYQEEVSTANPTGQPSSSLDDIPGIQSVEMAMVVARVGSEVVLAGDLMTPTASEWLAKVSPGLKPEQIQELKLKIYEQVLGPHLETLLVYVDACRTIPEERLPEIREKVDEAFDKEQLPKMVEAAGLSSIREYEELLRSQGQSLERMRKMFFERALAQEWMQQNANTSGEIPHAEMIAWYQNHLDEFEFAAKARFEQLTVKISPSQPRDAAWNRLAAMGNEVLQGRPLAEVAKEQSEGATARSGGQYDWTSRGSLVSKVVDEAIFRLPIGELSAILDDGEALHIVRVTERTDAGCTPFIEAQVGIRANLVQERRKRGQDEYLKRLRDQTPVWTIFEDDAEPTVIAGRNRRTR